MRCPFCEQPIDRNNAWKGTADRFYCSEFCADSECVIPSRQQSLKDRFDRQYLARLERLVALRQQQGESLLSPPPESFHSSPGFSFLSTASSAIGHNSKAAEVAFAILQRCAAPRSRVSSLVAARRPGASPKQV
jgi:hypothetical protein